MRNLSFEIRYDINFFSVLVRWLGCSFGFYWFGFKRLEKI